MKTQPTLMKHIQSLRAAEKQTKVIATAQCLFLTLHVKTTLSGNSSFLLLAIRSP